MELLDRLLEHDRWATTQLLNVSRGLTDDQLDEPFDLGHRTLRATFDHMIFNDEAWTALMATKPVEAQRDDRPLPTLIDRHERAYAARAALARRSNGTMGPCVAWRIANCLMWDEMPIAGNQCYPH